MTIVQKVTARGEGKTYSKNVIKRTSNQKKEKGIGKPEQLGLTSASVKPEKMEKKSGIEIYCAKGGKKNM